MILQTLDIQNNCAGIFYEGRITLDTEAVTRIVEECKIAWKHSDILNDEKYTYLYVLSAGEDLNTFSKNPELYNYHRSRIQAQARAYAISKADTSEICFFDSLPTHQLINYFQSRSSALENLFKKKTKDSDYQILHKAHVLTTEISKKKVNFGGENKNIEYNIFGSATGRFTTTKFSVPVLTLKKEERGKLIPQNDLYLELDLNGAEVRTLLALSKFQQPLNDIHEWNKQNICRNLTTRREAKERFFAWLYNPDSSDYMLEKMYNKHVYKEFYTGGKITTPFNRVIKVEERKALSYLLQSTTSDIVIQNVYKIMKFLSSRKTFVAFTMHDSVILDFSREDRDLVKDIKGIFDKNEFGIFPSRAQIGKNFGDMREIQF